MCGICGFIQSEPLRDDAESLVRTMRDEMTHRGPDGKGMHLGKTYALGHRRLSIVDLSSNASQPMTNEDGTVWITFNGEIYNHMEIRRTLQSYGHTFCSLSDTEVIIHGWEQWGQEIVDRLNGMFAFCIVDERKRCSFLARDRFGIKPLYYFVHKGFFVFASEIKALLHHPACPKSVCYDVLGEYFLFRNIAGERTLFAGINELLPGTHLTLDHTLNLCIKQYWQINLPEPDTAGNDMSPEEYLAALQQAVKLRMMSDVPLGTQLSGGIDSSTVTKLSNDLTSFPIRTFSIGFKESMYNELPYAKRMSDQLETDHCPIQVDADDFIRELDKVVWFMDTPIDHPNSVFLYLLCKRAKEDVTVLLTGEGADESLAGYDRYASYERSQKMMAVIPSFIQRMMNFIPNGCFAGRLGLLKEWSKYGTNGMAIRNSIYGRGLLPTILAKGLEVDLCERERIIERYSSGTPIDRLLRYDQQVYLLSILQRQDRVSMGASVESRVPFLDHTLMETVNRLPIRKKLGVSSKYILRKAVRDIIPTDIIERPKMGFPIPIEQWFRNDGLLSTKLDCLLDPGSFVCDILGRQDVEKLVVQHRVGSCNHAEVLWILLSMELWKQRFF